jgi:3-hydroxyisobutyrate dehydrogenase-like beta-hydroxyacid dehydrogenase
MKLSFIGLGSMGNEMAKRLIDAGHDVGVWNRSPEPVAAMVAVGARAVATVKEAFDAPVVFSMLSNDAAALDQFSAENLAGAATGTIHVNMSSLSVAAADELEARHKAAGVGYIAAPVLGRPPVAAAGQLNILAGGAQSDIDAVQPLLDVLGKKTWVMGPTARTANLVKICVNFNLIHAIEALGESVALVESGGVDANLFVELLTSSLFGGMAYSGYGAAIANKTYRPAGFTVALGSKDLSLVEAAAAEAGLHLPTVPALREVFNATLADAELEAADWASIAEISRNSNK